jgi:hypothetical protein
MMAGMTQLERGVEVYAIVNLLVIGVSHVVRPRVWVELFVALRERGEAGVFGVALLNLIFGSIIAGFHNVWSGLPAVLTVVGWANVIKALVYFVFPGVGLRRLKALSLERGWMIRVAGVGFLIIAALLGYHVCRAP